MSTLIQSVKKKKIFKKSKVQVKALENCPQKRGICMKLTIMSPKKPNSADRKIAKLRLSTLKKIIAYVPGIGHNLQNYASVLVRGGGVPDLPGIHYKLIKGKYDFSWKEVFLRRKQRRSKYGVPSVRGRRMRRRKRKKHRRRKIKK